MSNRTNINVKPFFNQTFRDAINLDYQGKLAQRVKVESDLLSKRELLETLPEVLRVHDKLRADVATKRQIVTDSTMALQPLRDKKIQLARHGPGHLAPVTELEKPVPATIPSAFLGLIAFAISTFVGLGLALIAIIGRESTIQA